MRLGIDIITTRVGDAAVYNSELGLFDAILCDVPCSGLGVIRRKPDIKYKPVEDFSTLQEIQYSILENAVKFSMLSPDGDQGLPGNFNISVTYTVTDDNGLKISYDGVCDKDTYASLTNHSYFNLDGETSDSILDQVMWIKADAYTRVSEEMISTGEFMDVTGTAMDFRTAKAIGRDIGNDEEPLRIGGGYDHNWVISEHAADEAIASLVSEKSGIKMEVFTDCPGLQMYTGNFLQNKDGGKRGRIYPDRSGVAFETQQFPDAMHHENFPSPLVKAGEAFHTETEYRFSK